MAIKCNFYELCCLLISITLVVRAWTPDITPKLINPKTGMYLTNIFSSFQKKIS